MNFIERILNGIYQFIFFTKIAPVLTGLLHNFRIMLHYLHILVAQTWDEAIYPKNNTEYENIILSAVYLHVHFYLLR